MLSLSLGEPLVKAPLGRKLWPGGRRRTPRPRGGKKGGDETAVVKLCVRANRRIALFQI